MNKYYKLRDEYDEIDSDDSVDSIIGKKGDRRRSKGSMYDAEVTEKPGLERDKTREELVEDVRGLLDIANDRRRFVAKCDTELKTYREAKKAINKDVEDRTAKDFENIERLTSKGWLHPTPEVLKLHYRHTKMLKTRALDKANLAVNKAFAGVNLFGLKDAIFKQPNATSSAVTDSTEENKLDKRKFNSDDGSDNNNNSKRTKVSTFNEKN